MRNELMESFNRGFDKKLSEEFKIISSLNEFEPWGEAVDTWDRIIDAEKLEDLERHLDFEFPDGLSSRALNDYLISNSNQVLHDLGISEYPKTIKVKVWGIEYEDNVDAISKPTKMEVEVEVEDEYDDIREKVHDALYDELPLGIGYYDISDFEFEEIKDTVDESVNESSEIDKIDADADDKKEKLKAFMKKKNDDIDADRDEKKKKIREASDVSDQVIISKDEYFAKKPELEKQGYKVLWSGNGKVCFAKAKEIKEDLLNEEGWEPDVEGFVKEMKEVIPSDQINTHESDLYVLVTPKSKELLKKYNMYGSDMLSVFTDQIDHKRYFDIPFGNLGGYLKQRHGDDYGIVNADESLNEYLSAEEAAKHVTDENGKITILGKGASLGSDFYKDKDGNIISYNFEVGECDHPKNFNLLGHLEDMIEDGFKIIKSDDVENTTKLHLDKYPM